MALSQEQAVANLARAFGVGNLTDSQEASLNRLKGAFRPKSTATTTGTTDTTASVQTPTSPRVVTKATPEIAVEDIGTQPMQTPQAPQTTDSLYNELVRVGSSISENEQKLFEEQMANKNSIVGLGDLSLERTEEQARLEQRAGIGDLEKQINDINASIKAKAAGLQADLENIGQQGFRATAVRGQEARARRQVAAEISGLQAAAEAAQGNIEVANSSIDRALRAKYGDIEQRLEIAQNALQANQALFTTAEKIESRKREAELSVLSFKIESAKELERNALQNISTATTNGYNPQKAADLMKRLISGEISPPDVIAAVGGKLRDPIDVINESLKWMEYNAAVDAQNRIESGEWTEDQSEAVSEVSAQLRSEPSYKEMFEIRAGYNTAVTGADQNNGFGDIAMVNGYQRMIDPGATVRGEDIKTQAEAVAYVQQALNLKGKIMYGDRFTGDTREKLEKAINEQYKARVDEFDNNTKKRYQNIISRSPVLSKSGISFGDIGDEFSYNKEGSQLEPVNPETIKIGEEFELGGVKYIKTGVNSYEEIN